MYIFQVCQLLHDPTVRLHEVEVSLFSPFRPMLAERCNVRTVEESLKRSQFYYVETKYDGERFQLHVENGVFRYFSRLECLTFFFCLNYDSSCFFVFFVEQQNGICVGVIRKENLSLKWFLY